MKKFLNLIPCYLNLFPLTRKLFNLIGPAVWRLPAFVRRRLCSQVRLHSLKDTRIFVYGESEKVCPQLPPDHPATFGHRIAGRPYGVAPPFVSEIKQSWLVGQHATPVTTNGNILLTPFRDQVKFMTY